MKSLIPLALLTILLTAGWWIAPHQVENWPLCWFHYFFHLDCPGCGLTRSFLSLARGDFLAAFHYNAAGPLVYLLFLVYFIELSLKFFKREKRFVYPLWLTKIYGVSFVALFFGHWVLRIKAQLF